MKSLMICTPHQILFGDQIKKSVLDGAWKPEGRDHWEGPGVGSKIILKWIFRK